MSERIAFDSGLPTAERDPTRCSRQGPWRFMPIIMLVLGCSGARGDEAPDRGGAAADFFETSVRPVLVESCFKCHGPEKQSSGLRLDSREAVLTGGDNGPAVVPGKPGESLLVQAVAHTHQELKMPPKKKLPDPVVAAIRRWVELGAPWGTRTASGADAGMARSHWAFAPIRHVAP